MPNILLVFVYKIHQIAKNLHESDVLRLVYGAENVTKKYQGATEGSVQL